MGNLLFFLVLPGLFFLELCLIGFGSPHLTLLAFSMTLVCSRASMYRSLYAALFAAAAVLAHGGCVTPVVAGLLASCTIWYFFRQILTRNWITQSLVVVLLMTSMLLLGGDFSWTVSFVIANIIIVPVMVWLWCGV